MVQSVTFNVLVAALLINTHSFCCAENVYCVTPTGTLCSSCPHNSIHCATLSKYAHEAELHFTSNTTMVFLPGDHILDRNVAVGNVARLTMCGFSLDTIATVVRNPSVGFSFSSMVDFRIYSLAFTSYNRSQSYHSHAASSSVLLLQFTLYATLVNCSFHHNIGTALVVRNTIITLAGYNEFKHNQCACESAHGLACGIIALHSNLIFTGNTLFWENHQMVSSHCAGAIWAFVSSLHFTGTSIFIGNSADTSCGGAIHAEVGTSLRFSGTGNFSHNSAELGGAFCTINNVVLDFNGINKFINNSAPRIGGAIFTKSNVSVRFTGTTSLSSNSARQGGAIAAGPNSTLTFGGNITFTNNGNATKDSRGGAIYLFIGSHFFIMPNTTVHWNNNHADLGGAIYVSAVNPLIYCTQISAYIPKDECFFQLPGQNLSNGLDVHFIFKSNTACDAGTVLYGGAIDSCKLTGLHSYNSGEVFDQLVHNEDGYNTTSKVSSIPVRICPCKNNIPLCSLSLHSLENIPYPHLVYPGETFHVSVVAVGQRDGTVSSIVRSTARTDTIYFDDVTLLDYQYLQQSNNTCTKLNYTVFALSQHAVLVLSPEGSPCSKYIDGKLYIAVNLNQTCPPGFNISESARSCVCEPRLTQYTNQCNITYGLGQITRDSGQHFWVGYDNTSQELILHPHCPLDYCVNDAKVFPLNNTDIQCDYNRSGLLCGHCKEGYSLVLGTSQCRTCTNIFLLLFILFALMGVALVFLLLVCKLTVAAGTLSGLVFYSNIVGVNRTIFLPVRSTNALSVFIAWLNLDFGIETCFYDGMDAYSKIWLQFAFPVYIWVLMGLMIFISYYSQRFANLLGTNPVSVLATLILLSYAKILRTLVTALYFTHLEYPTYNRSVWLHDANVDFIIGKHIPLFLVALLIFFFLFLPYTFLLLFGQWLQAISHLRLFSWVNSARLKPFMDSYHAPYKGKHRYWPGLLLVLRFALLLVFALNRQRDTSINLLATLLGAGILQLWAWVSGGVYKSWYLDALEGSFVLNLIALGVATYHVQLSGGDQLTVGYTSVSITVATFLGILAYHIFQQLRQTTLWKKVPKPSFNFNKLMNTKQRENNLNNPINNTSEFDRLRESLLDDLPHAQHSHSAV